MAVQRRVWFRSDWQFALAITVLLRLVYSAIAAIASVVIHPNTALVRSNALTENLPLSGSWRYAWLGIWERFDTLWYLRIAKRGYDLSPAVVFYPLYPWLIRILSWIIDPTAGALLISTVAAFFYFYGLLRLAKLALPDGNPRRTALIAAVWPASLFFFAGYTEALACALIVWCIYWGRREDWLPASLCALLAGLTRSAGTLLIVPLVIIAWRARGNWTSRAWILLSPLGTLSYWLWLNETHRLSVVVAYRTFWSTEVAAPWTTLWVAIRSLADRFDWLVLISLVALVWFVIAGVIARRRTEDRCFSAAVIVHLLLRFCWPSLLGAPRYLLSIYPAYLTAGERTQTINRTRFAFLCAVLFAINLGWMWAFLNWSLVL